MKFISRVIIILGIVAAFLAIPTVVRGQEASTPMPENSADLCGSAVRGYYLCGKVEVDFYPGGRFSPVHFIIPGEELDPNMGGEEPRSPIAVVQLGERQPPNNFYQQGDNMLLYTWH